jgi:hypothetical protein
MLGRLHWIIYKDAAIIFILAILAFWFTESPDGAAEGWDILLPAIGWALLVLAICMAVHAWFTQWITEIAVTNHRVIYKRGFIVTQSILGRILDYGSIHVRGTGEGIEHLHRIRASLNLRNCILAR